MKRELGFSRFFTCSVMILLLVPLVLDAQVIAVKAKKIYTGSHGIIENGVILIQERKIQDVGSGLEIPWNAEVVDFSQKVILPGLVEAHAARGYDVANETNPLTPFVTVLDNIDTSHDDFQTALKDGVTTLNIMPGNNTILGGKGAVVKSVGLVVEDMLLIPESGMKLSVAGTPAQTRMGVMAQLRRYFNETIEYMEAQEKAEQKEGEKMVSTPGSFRSPERVKYDSVVALLKGQYKAFIYCQSSADVIRANDLSEKFNIILDPELVYFERDPFTDEVKKIDVPEVFHEKDIEFALQSDPGKVQSRSLFYQGMRTIQSGLDLLEALKTVTVIPAQILGADSLIGSIDKGKLANFVVLDDEPFKLSTKVEFVYIDGKPVYEREKDEELKKLLEEKIIK
jgi:imidazolonepropionase-like amidohydrolase